MIVLTKKYRTALSTIIILLLISCSNKNSENKTGSPHQNKIDSLSLVKKNKAIEAGKLRHELDSLQKHLDSIKAIQ